MSQQAAPDNLPHDPAAVAAYFASFTKIGTLLIRCMFRKETEEEFAERCAAVAEARRLFLALDEHDQAGIKAAFPYKDYQPKAAN